MGDGTKNIENSTPNVNTEDVTQVFAGGGAGLYEQSLGAGDEGVGSPTLSRKRINNAAQCTILASSTGAQAIGGATGVPVYIKGITALRDMVGTVTIAGFSTPTSIADRTNTVVVAAAGTPSESTYEILHVGPARAFPDGCDITCSTAADGPFVEILWETMP